MARPKKKLKIFISYSHKNIKYKEKLLVSLDALKQSYEIEPWHDGLIDAGGNIDENIRQALASADIVLLLVTDNFISSYYCIDKELKEAIERENKGLCKVIPVMFQESVLTDTLSFFGHNRVPEDGRPIATGFQNQSLGCTRAVKKIGEMIDRNFPQYKKSPSHNITTNKSNKIKNIAKDTLQDIPRDASKTFPKKITKSTIRTTQKLSVNLYKNGKITPIQINQDFIDLLPKYCESVFSFLDMMNQSLSEAKMRYNQSYRYYKKDIPPTKKLQQFRLFLMDICA